MKTSQSIAAVCILAVMVFVITFAMNYLGGGGDSQGPKPQPRPDQDERELTFLTREYPAPGGFPIDFEEKKVGAHDYWFHNENEEPVKVGLNRKSCKCTSVQVFVPGPKAQERLRPYLAVARALGEGGLLQGFDSAVLEAGRAAVEGQAEPHELLHKEEVVSVPAGAAGWVRLQWQAERIGPQRLDAALWMGNKDSGKTATLMAGLFFHEPVRLSRDLELGTLRQEQLARGVSSSIVLWSSTRPQLRLQARAVGQGRPPSADPFVVGPPEPLSEQGRADLEKRNSSAEGPRTPMNYGKVLCAYRIPLTLRAVAADGRTPFDLGPFRRRVEVQAGDVDEPIQVTVTGRVRGLVSVANDEQGGNVTLGGFPSSKGKRATVALESEVPGVDLGFDRKRTPPFLDARLGAPQTSTSGRRAWQLRVEVLPNQARGPFPRREDPPFQDSAIYLNALQKGKPPLPVRIPVIGTANEG